MSSVDYHTLTWPDISCPGMSGLRYYSDLNPWIDFVVLFDAEKYDRQLVTALIDDAAAFFWDDDESCYGDVVEQYLRQGGVDSFVMLYHDSFDESWEYEQAWEEHIRRLPIIRTAEFV